MITYSMVRGLHVSRVGRCGSGGGRMWVVVLWAARGWCVSFAMGCCCVGSMRFCVPHCVVPRLVCVSHISYARRVLVSGSRRSTDGGSPSASSVVAAVVAAPAAESAAGASDAAFVVAAAVDAAAAASAAALLAAVVLAPAAVVRSQCC